MERPLAADSRPGAACGQGAVAGRVEAGPLSLSRSRASQRESPRFGQSSRSGHSSSFLLAAGVNKLLK